MIKDMTLSFVYVEVARVEVIWTQQPLKIHHLTLLFLTLQSILVSFSPLFWDMGHAINSKQTSNTFFTKMFSVILSHSCHSDVCSGVYYSEVISWSKKKTP